MGGAFQSAWVAELIERRTSAGERALEGQKGILRAIDRRVKWYHAAEILGMSGASERSFG